MSGAVAKRKPGEFSPATQPGPLTVPAETLERQIYLIRGQRVMLDSDLAGLYQVLTKNLNKAVARNPDRFPEDFMFRLNAEDAERLRFQVGTSNAGRGGRRYLPYVFTEHGVAMLSSVLNSARAVQMNILIVRAFVRMRETAAAHKDFAARVERVEVTQERHASAIRTLAGDIADLKRLPPPRPKRSIGFTGTA